MTNKKIIMEEFRKFVLENSREVYIGSESFLRAYTDKLNLRADDFAESLLSKLLPEQKILDRNNVEKILYDCVMDNHEEYPVKEVLEKYADQICQLIPPIEKLGTKEEIRGILTRLIGEVQSYKLEEAITELSNLSKPSGEVITKLQRHINMQNLTITGLEEQLEGIPKITPYSNTAGPEQDEASNGFGMRLNSPKIIKRKKSLNKLRKLHKCKEDK